MSALADTIAVTGALWWALALFQSATRVHSQVGTWLLPRGLLLPLALLGMCLCVAGARAESRAASFYAKGNVRCQFFGDSTNTVLFTNIQVFEVDIDGSRWAVKAHAVPEDGHPVEMMCDGVYTYSATTGLTTSRNSPMWPSTEGLIKKDIVPFDSAGHAVGCIWLTLASSFYLDAEKHGLFSPAWIEINRTESSLLGDRFRAQILRLAREPKLPESIDCWANGLQWGRSGRDRSALPSPFNEGYLCFKYRTQSATNFGALQIPTASTLDFFLPKPGGKDPTDICQALRVQVTVDEINPPIKRATWRPELESRVRIEDFRFVTAKPQMGVVSYVTSGGTWPKESDEVVASARQYASDKAYIARIQSKGQESRRWLVLGVMLLLTFVFVAYFFRLRQPAR